MKRFFALPLFVLSIFISILFTSCNSEPQFLGAWNFEYSIRDGVKYPKSFQARILDFSVDTLRMIEFDYNTGMPDLVIDTIESKFLHTGGTITIHSKDRDVVMIAVVAGDSLIWSYEDTTLGTAKYVYRRLKSSTKNGVSADLFTGKSFALNNNGIQDSIFFMDAKHLLFTGEFNFNFPVKDWTIANYKGFDFLMIQESILNMEKISVNDKGEIHLGNNANVVMTETIGDLSKSGFLGTWEEVFVKARPDFPFGDADAQPANVHITFTADSMQMEYRGKSFSRDWNVTPDSKRIYFPYHISRSAQSWWFQNGTWKIIGKTEEQLKLHVYTKYMEGMGGDTIVLKRLPQAMSL